jgi:hypothetical protein
VQLYLVKQMVELGFDALQTVLQLQLNRVVDPLINTYQHSVKFIFVARLIAFKLNILLDQPVPLLQIVMKR